MKVNNNYILREIAGEYILVSLGTSASSFNGLITLNEIGGKIFKLLSQERTVEELVMLITAEYEIDSETAEADINEYVQQLRQIGALTESGEIS